jgi:hypothetical protein
MVYDTSTFIPITSFLIAGSDSSILVQRLVSMAMDYNTSAEASVKMQLTFALYTNL